MELNLAGVDELLNLPDNPSDELDLSGVPTIISPKSKKHKSNKIVFQPESSDWTLARLNSVRDYFKQTFGRDLPVSVEGQGKIHNKWKLAHQQSADIGLDPDSSEGKSLMQFLESKKIPYLAFRGPIPGVATGKHIHIGKASHRIGKEIPQEDLSKLDLNLDGLDEILQSPTQELDLSGIGDIKASTEITPEEIAGSQDPNKLDFKVGTEQRPAILDWLTRDNKPVITGKNPNQVGDVIRTTFTHKAQTKPDINTITDTWLNAWNPQYAELNRKFRKETGGLNIAILDSPKNIIYKGDRNYEVVSRPTRGVQALFEAYKNGGLPAFNATNKLINQQLEQTYVDQRQLANQIAQEVKAHPYVAASMAGVERSAKNFTQLGTNLKYLGQAYRTGISKGWDSQEYIDVINKEIEEQDYLASTEASIYNPPSFAGKVVAGVIEGAITFPVYAAAARVSPMSLPLMAYAENLHRGNREAAIAAMPMAILVGTGRGLAQFTDRGYLVNRNILDDEGNLVNKTFEIGAGAGSKAPFSRVPRVPGKFTKEDLSLFTNRIAQGESVSIAQLTPFERQLIHRGANALSLQIPVGGTTVQDIAANMVVGLFMPVGKSPKKVEFGPYPTATPKPKVPLQIGETRIPVPLTEAPRYGKFPIIEQQREVAPVVYPSAESPNVAKYKEPFEAGTFVSETEKGFQARGTGETLFLDLDTANLNLIELKRALEEKTYTNKGDDLKTSLQKQQAIKNAILVLEKAIPDETKQFFQENEQLIREALKTNQLARNEKSAFLQRKAESLKPHEVETVDPKPPVVRTGNESTPELFAGKAGDFNTGTSQEKAHEILNNFFKITTQGTFKSAIIPYGDILAGKMGDLGYLSAFYIEDFYHRGIVPSVEIVLNKIKTSIGDLGKHIDESQAKEIFKRGMDYYNANIADPFFSRMKQDAAEKLPNRFTAEQARNILSLHKDEFEWTSGLDEFLASKDKFSKQELIDYINNNQVRVEEKILKDVEVGDREWVIQNRISQIDDELAILEEAPISETGILPNNIKWNKLIDERAALRTEQDNIKSNKPKYSLKAYRGEKLELPGAENSKEVILTTPFQEERFKENNWVRDPRYDTIDGFGWRFTGIDNSTLYGGDIVISPSDTIPPTGYFKRPITIYRSPHWDFGNEVAHYRANDRTTTDGKRTYFSEEFQSDWAHDIREKGLRYTTYKNAQEVLDAGFKVEWQDSKTSDLINLVITDPQGGRVRTIAAYEKSKVIDSLPEIRDAFLKSGEIEKEVNRKSNRGIEPMPFMGHLWKELVMKRFIRDAVTARKKYRIVEDKVTAGEDSGKTVYSVYEGDTLVRNPEDFNSFFNSPEEAQKFIDTLPKYKYDGIGWTTARQQKERYGKILEGKDFTWRKNSDGTYTFGIFETIEDSEQFGGSIYEPHELQDISLERFAELTTKEAAQEVRDQEANYANERGFLIKKKDENLYLDEYEDQYTNNRNRFKVYNTKEEAQKSLNDDIYPDEAEIVPDTRDAKGQFSLKEAVELRSGVGKYSDYDVALVNIAKKIGKRFGANYSKKEIPLGIQESRRVLNDSVDIDEALKNGAGIYNANDNKIDPSTAYQALREGSFLYTYDKHPNKAEIHFLDITPSMRASLEKEGLPLYGLGGNEPLKNQEIGIRNRLTTREAFDEHRNNLVKALESYLESHRSWQYENIPEQTIEAAQQQILTADKTTLDMIDKVITSRQDTIFNSGLSPDAFIDQAKLLYKGMKDFQEFSSTLIKRYGDQIKPYLQDLWIQVKDLAKKFHEDERGFLNLQLRKMQSEAGKRYKESKKKSFYFDNYSLWRGIGLAQANPELAGPVYGVIRAGQRVKNSFQHNVIEYIDAANKLLRKNNEADVAETIWQGNEQGRTYTRAELLAGDPATNRPILNAEQADAYFRIRAAEDINLDIRRDTKLHALRERANRLNDQLATATGSRANEILGQLLDITDSMNRVNDHFENLKRTGYISTKRKGKFAAFVHDPAFPTGDKRGEVYQQFETFREADAWVKAKEAELNANSSESVIHDVRIPQRLRLAAAKLTPGQFEDLIDSAGVNPHAPEIETLRDEIYSRYPSFAYELKRDFVRGYDRNWQFVTRSIADQTEVFANSFYSRVAGEQALQVLDGLGVQAKNPELYDVLQKYVDHEISAAETSKAAIMAGQVRKRVYLFQLGFDVAQLYLNAVAQPISQTYSYFARVDHNGQRLKGVEPEKYFARAWKLSGEVVRKALTGSGNVPAEFEAIKNRLIAEDVISAEFNKSLLELETERSVKGRISKKGLWQTYEHWASGFMRAGEKTTRMHAVAEAYLVGKEKFNLSGEELVNFMVKAVDATQSNPSRAEAPLIVRGSQNTGEVRKLLYQFNAFNHMWIENLALNVRADWKAKNISATARHIAPLVIMGGVTGLPMAGVASALVQAITGEDPRKHFHKFMGNHDTLERMALYGITTDATLSRRSTPAAPFVDNIRVGDSIEETISETLSANMLPAVSTGAQILRGLNDIRKGDYLRGAGQVFPAKIGRGAITAYRYSKQGVKTRGGRTIIPRSKITAKDVALQTAGFAPSKVTEYYEEKEDKRKATIIREGRRDVIRRLKKILQ